MEDYTIDPIQWIIRDKNGMSRGSVVSIYPGDLRAHPSYGIPQKFSNLDDAADYVAYYVERQSQQ